MASAADVIAAVRARGNDATDLRDAAHEAHHALDAKVPEGQWDRETIHRHVMKLGRGGAAASEIMARAVEQIVCERLGVDAEGTVETWAFVGCMEAMKAGVRFPSLEWFVERVKDAMASRTAELAADAVIALASQPVQAEKRRRKAR